ncbi:fimbrial biogenesis outer membrane usher protein [Neisseriaceae bacterium TC5R-5]|nr:fimbrial biogenesis outer membrane usher protein [Neisseriaceae bacterium TC5R-5]
MAFALPALTMGAELAQQPSESSDSAFHFDSSLLLGSAAALGDVERFNHANAASPGTYQVDVYINDHLQSRKQVEFRDDAKNRELIACLDNAYLLAAGVLPASLGITDKVVAADSAQDKACVPLRERLAGARSQFDFPRLRLNLSIPQALMVKVAHDSVPLAELDVGGHIAFINYDASYHYSSSQGKTNDSFYINTNGGVNLDLWRLRQQSSYTRSSVGASEFQVTRVYAQRTLPSLQSELTVGESFTRGSLLNSMSFRGVQIQSDEQMLPDSVRGYAPAVRGIAATSARVVIRQGNNQIYQTTVAPGAFEITDIAPTSNRGSLDVEVQEADGRVSQFSVPFSVVPQSMRPGYSRYSATLGQVRDIPGSKALFSDVTYERGISNAITGNMAVRMSQNYLALLGGAVWGSSFGAFGLTTTYSKSRNINDVNISGWRTGLDYSYAIAETGTNFSLGSYRYSTGAFRDLSEAINTGLARQQGQIQAIAAYQQRNQFTANISQDLGVYGQLSLSASASDYYSNKQSDTQLQLSYSNSFHSMQYSVSISRQQMGALSGKNTLDSNSTSQTSNAVMFSVSMPLGKEGRAANLSSSVTQSDGRNNYQTSLSGLLDEAKTVSYNLGVSYDEQGHAANFNTSLQKSLALASVGATYSQGQNFWQSSASARGAVAVHAGGVTLGPYLSDTFALVEAPGAAGASIQNAMGATINSSGYALVPSLNPYRYNDVVLENKGLNRHTELTNNQIRVAPYAGMAVKLKFTTRSGQALLIKALQADGSALPLGATVYDSEGNNVGMVGQGGQTYVRVAGNNGKLTVKWGEQAQQQCTLPYQLDTKAQADQLLSRLDATCGNA